MSKSHEVAIPVSPAAASAHLQSAFQRRFHDPRSQRQIGYYITYARDTDARNARNLRRWTDELAWRWYEVH